MESPAMSSYTHTPTGRLNRRGLGNACHLCRHRKIRCDRAKPACETCRLAAVPCVFTPLPARPRKTIHQKLADTRAQIQQLEEELRAQKRPSPILRYAGPRLEEPGRFDTAIAAFQWHMPFFDPDPIFDLDEFYRELIEEAGSPCESEPTSFGIVKWPSARLVRCALHYYKSTGLYSVFPAVDVDEVDRILNSSNFDLEGESIDVASRACLAAFTALVTGLRRDEPVFVAIGADPIAYVRAALTLLPELAMHDTNVRALEALLLLTLYICPLGLPQTGEVLLSMAVKILFNLGGNTKNPKQNGQHLRALFWVAYGIDKENCLRRSRPPLINDADCDLDLPGTYVSEYADYHFFGGESSPSSTALLYPADLRMAILKSRIYRLLYSVEGQRQSMARRLQYIRELDQELSDMKADFPHRCQPDGFAWGSVPDTLFHDLNLRGVSIHLGYYFCLTKIHAAASMGNDSFSPPPPSSVEVCYQAARSTLLYISRVRQGIIPETYWIYAQFIITAVLALYRRLLVAPDGSYVYDDIQIMDEIAGIFSRLYNSSCDAGRPFAPYMITERFVSKITALARERIT
ncbi:uncharacterized protein APUU_50405S [Aspergillus puulaauensis]|uniref:Zn(2)-C6 fungal-type domain-containing protein n=1 Tax=Aspergillus puulaauensis TaxID=1220207 RepID=A0A7R7XRY1_9EURO|nr:uncharacterized protein APUU_50405S [Aspergillus puulaauensis]BCS25694.1 hypothetical protein APUU_50405S [Aspergillus puulaauensis]